MTDLERFGLHCNMDRVGHDILNSIAVFCLCHRSMTGSSVRRYMRPVKGGMQEAPAHTCMGAGRSKPFMKKGLQSCMSRCVVL